MSRQLALIATLLMSVPPGMMGVQAATGQVFVQNGQVHQVRSVLVYPAGTEIVVTAIDPSDLFYSFSADFIGKPMVVASSDTGLVSRDGGTWWGGRATLVSSGQTVSFSKVTVTSPSTPTVQYDTTPDLFSLAMTTVTGALPGTAVTSNTLTVKGIEVATSISITGGEYAIDGGSFTAASGTVGLDQTVVVKVIAPSGFGETATATLNIGGVTSTFSVTTVTTPGDYSPDAFSFTAVSNVAPGTLVESDEIIVRGITATTPISISGGEYSINGGSWTSATGTVALGNQVKVRLTAPATYGAEGSATLTIGDVSAGFTATTRAFTPVAAVTEVFSNAGTAATVVDGIVQINEAPTQPLAIPSDATVNAVVALNTSAPVQVLSGTNTLDIVRQETDTVMQVVTVGSNPALIPIAGSVSIGAPQGNTTIPVAGGTTGSATVVTSTANTTVVTGPSTTTVGNRVVAVSSGGPVTYTGTVTPSGRSTRALPTSFSVYPGEAVLADDSGAAGQVRLGSFAQDGSQAGDYIANLPRAASTLQVPRVAGTSERFSGQEWSLLVGQAIAAKLGLGTATSLTQDATTGIMTLVTSSGTYRFLPVGSLALADAALNGGSRAVSVAAIAANLTAILDSSLSFAVAPATAYADLEQALKSLSSTASLEVLGDGVIKASLSGMDYIAQPAAQATDGNTTGCPGFVTENNQLALCDASGKRQVLNAAFADTDTLISTFEADLGDLSVSNAGSNGRYALLYQGMGFSLYPDIVLATPPSTQAGRLWWLDSASGKIYVRYPNGSAQGFSLQ